MANNVVDGGLDEFLKENVYPNLQDAINIRSEERQIFSGIEDGRIDGKWFRFSFLTKGNFRMEGRAERAYLPGTDTSVTNANDAFPELAGIEAKFNRKQLYSGIELSGPAFEAGRGAGGFEELGRLIMKQTMDAFPEMVSRQWATGRSQVLGELASTPGAGATSLTLKEANGPSTEANAVPWAGNRLVRPGMVLDFVTGTGTVSDIDGAVRTTTAQNERGRLVSAVSEDNSTPTVTIDALGASHNLADGDLLIPYNTRVTAAITQGSDSEAKWYNADGIMDAVNNSSDPHYPMTYYGTLAKASNPVLQSKMLNASASVAAMTLAQVNRLCEQIKVDPNGGGEPDVGYCTPGVWRKFIESNNLVAISSSSPQRFVEPGKGFKPTLGVSGVQVNVIGAAGQMTTYTSALAPQYRYYAVQRSTLMMLQDKPLGTLNRDGLDWRMNGTAKDAWMLFFGWYCTGIVNKAPVRSGYILNVAGDQLTS